MKTTTINHKLKKLFCFLLAVSLLFVVSSCGEEEIIGNENPTLEEFYDPLQNYGLQFDMETEYDNFIAYTEYEEYSPDTERIACAIYNNNPGKGFYIYKSVFVEKNIDGGNTNYFKSLIRKLGDSVQIVSKIKTNSTSRLLDYTNQCN